MAKSTTPAKSRAAPAAAAKKELQSVGDALHQLETTKASTEALAIIGDVYERFLTQKDVRKVIEALDELRDARFLESHAWRVRDAALDEKTQPKTLHAWLLTVILLVSHRLRGYERASDIAAAWAFVDEDLDAWRSFVVALTASSHRDWTLREKAALMQFLINCYASLDVEPVASEFVKLVSLPMWRALSPAQRELDFADHPKVARQWKKLFSSEDAEEPATPAKKKRKTEAPAKTVEGQVTQREKSFLVGLLADFTDFVQKDTKHLKDDDDALRYVALTVSLLLDLLGQMPTRKFLHVVLRRKHVLALLRQSPFFHWCTESRSTVETTALTKQIDHLEKLLHFPIAAHTGKSLTTLQEHKAATTMNIQALQLAAFSAAYRDSVIETLAIAPVSAILDRNQFKEQLQGIVQADRHKLEEFGETIGLFAETQEAQALSTEILIECFVEEYSSETTSASTEHRVTLPTEHEIWSDPDGQANHEDEENESPIYGTGRSVLFPVLALPKLGLQYLNLTDFLERNAALSQLEAAHALRRDLEEAIRPMDAIRSLARNGETVFRGFSPKAVPLETAFSIMKVEKPAIGETFPSSVIGQFDVELDTRHDVTAFDHFQHREVVYLVTIRPTKDEASEAMGFANESEDAGHFAEDYGVLYVRCAELTEILDESGKQIKHADSDDTAKGKGRKRTLTVALDGGQYKKDLEDGQLGAYEYVNLLVRRDPRANNFKAVLDAIAASLHSTKRDNAGGTLPSWLYDLYLGNDDSSSASYEEIAKNKLQAKVSIPLHHVFRDATHAVESCSQDAKHHTHLVDSSDKALAPKEATGPYTLVHDIAAKTLLLKAHKRVAGGDSDEPMELHRLTKEQAQVVIRGTAEGLTVVSGPDSSGKSEALAQLIQNLIQAGSADEKVLVVARSTAALNKLLTQVKTSPLVDEGGLVRLGGPTDTLSCQGRVDFLLQRRIDLLKEVEIMAKWMEKVEAQKYAGIGGSASYSCENALFFYRFYIKALFDEAKEATAIKDALLSQYHAERMGSGVGSVGELHAFAARMEGIYGELHRLQAYELLQLPAQRRDVYLMQHARVIAMTSRHAALQFKRLVDLKLKWTSVIVEDAAEINELDTFIPLALAATHNVKRVVVAGNPTRLPTVDTPDLKEYAHFHTSLFARLLRLGVPHITLSPLATSEPPKPAKAGSRPAPPKSKLTPTKKTPSKK